MSKDVIHIALLSKPVLSVFFQELTQNQKEKQLYFSDKVLCFRRYADSVPFLVRPSDVVVLDEEIHLMLVLVVEGRDSDYHFISVIKGQMVHSYIKIPRAHQSKV